MTRDEFIEKYIRLVYKVVHSYVKATSSPLILYDDMIGEASLKLVETADRFFADDKKQEAYVKHYIERVTINACAYVARQSRIITKPRDNPSQSFFAVGNDDLRQSAEKFMEKSKNGTRRIGIYCNVGPYRKTTGDENSGNTWNATDAFEPFRDCEDLFEQIARRRVVDWSEFFDEEDASFLREMTESYGDPDRRVWRHRNMPRARFLLRKYINEHCNR